MRAGFMPSGTPITDCPAQAKRSSAPAWLAQAMKTWSSKDAICDGRLVDDCCQSDVATCRATMRRRRKIRPRVVHGGPYPSFGPPRFRKIIDTYLARTCGT